MSKLNIKSFAILIFMIPILFVNSAGQNHALSSEQIKSRVPGPNSWNKTPSEDDIQRIMKELNTEQRNKLQTIVKTNIVQEMKDMIYDYYGKNTFDEPEWIRVKNFLDWIESNKDFLNRKFAMQKINLTEDHRKVFIGVFLGAHYVTDKMLGKTFDLSIY